MTINFNGDEYFDDRMYVLLLCRGTVEPTPDSDGVVWTTIYHEIPPKEFIWCLITYKNYKGYPISRVDHFREKEAAQRYLEAIEPQVPLISLQGKSPLAPLTFRAFADWKTDNKMKDYDYKTVFSPGGSNNREIIGQRASQFKGIK